MKYPTMVMELPLDLGKDEGWVGIPFPVPALLSLVTAGSLRLGTDARRRFISRFPGAGSGVYAVRQVHSRRVLLAPQTGSPSVGEDTVLGEGDGIIAPAGLGVLAVTVADCMPIFLHDSQTGAYGILHSGWRGTGILGEALSAMGCHFGTRPADVTCVLGPCISADAYHVDEDRARRYAAEWGDAAIRLREGRFSLDLRGANLQIAESVGIGSVTVVDHCTFGTPLLGSFRREGPDAFTSMLALLGPLWSEE